MERAGHRQALRTDPPPLEEHLHRVDRTNLTTDDGLLRRVLRTHPHLAGERGDRRGDILATRDHRQHRPLLRPELIDGGGTGLRGACPGIEAPGTCGNERRKLPEAVTGDDIGGESHLLENAPGKEIPEIHPPLRVPHDGPQTVVGLPGDAGELFVSGSTGLRIEGLDGLPRHRRLRDETAEHVGVLGSLPGEDRRHEAATRRRPAHRSLRRFANDDRRT